MYFDDQFPIGRQVAGLSDAAFRLHVTAIFWCARNLTDGAVLQEDLIDMCPRVRKPQRFITELVSRDIWHEPGKSCPSDLCPAPVGKGWVIHDFFDRMPSKERVAAERKGNAERQRRYRERQRNRTEPHPMNGGVSNAERNALLTPPRSVQSPKGTRTDEDSQSSSRHNARAWANDDDSIDRGIVQLLAELTSRDISLLDAAAIRHAILDGRSVKHRSRYVARAIEDDPGKFLPAAEGVEPSPLRIAPDWCGHCDERTRLLELRDNTAARCPVCHPLAKRPAS
ncbi:hypothetical protein [Nonomuraea sp. NEAU-A123]|uniref:hypothetical protein n=1 Tax=Nonomuraea sp. NEAU-A123 TaxID=2839649 RepID=UPI001BE49A58|nr:hypothetical protein [Nonomuraea sp. NEAU-A123]MBT2234428.1 hypothetical protein [Nonomuraea sp. NEAU-A123]